MESSTEAESLDKCSRQEGACGDLGRKEERGAEWAELGEWA